MDINELIAIIKKKLLTKINIKSINQLGSDRIVNSIEGKKFKNCLIIDFGTATTFDIVKNSIYEGGVIAPGVKLSMKNLSQSTALLPMFNLKNKQKSYGKNTKDALNAGFIWGYEGLINNIINKITLNFDEGINPKRLASIINSKNIEKTISEQYQLIIKYNEKQKKLMPSLIRKFEKISK